MIEPDEILNAKKAFVEIKKKAKNGNYPFIRIYDDVRITDSWLKVLQNSPLAINDKDLKLYEFKKIENTIIM